MMSLPRHLSFALLGVALTLVLSAMPLAGQQNDPAKGTSASPCTAARSKATSKATLPIVR